MERISHQPLITYTNTQLYTYHRKHLFQTVLLFCNHTSVSYTTSTCVIQLTNNRACSTILHGFKKVQFQEIALIHLEMEGEVFCLVRSIVLTCGDCSFHELVNSSTAGEDSHSGYTTVSPPLCSCNISLSLYFFVCTNDTC